MSDRAMKQYRKYFTREVHLESLIRQIVNSEKNGPRVNAVEKNPEYADALK